MAKEVSSSPPKRSALSSLLQHYPQKPSHGNNLKVTWEQICKECFVYIQWGLTFNATYHNLLCQTPTVKGLLAVSISIGNHMLGGKMGEP